MTALAAFIGAGVTVQKYFSDTNIQRKEENKLRIKEFKEEKLNKKREFEEKIAVFIEKLCSDSLGLQASAAASLLGIIRPDNREYLDPILPVLTINLKNELGRKFIILNCLTRTLEKCLQLMLDDDSAIRQDLEDIDLTRTKLIRPNLEKLIFRGIKVDIAFADLKQANLESSDLHRLRGMRVILKNAKLSGTTLQEARLNKSQCQRANFEDGNLVSATFKFADLRNANFIGAKLQSAHFENSDIRDAKFDNANLNDAYFYGAKLNDVTKRNIIKAKHWQKAHFDKNVKLELELQL